MSTWRGCGRASKRALRGLAHLRAASKSSRIYSQKNFGMQELEIRLGTQVKFIKRNQDKGLSIAAGKVETLTKYWSQRPQTCWQGYVPIFQKLFKGLA